ncbi:MAG: dTDP-4-dehydrorhamnose reductase [Rhodanobacteraceae bacterium]
MKILLLGANGQIGHALRRTLAATGQLVCATRSGHLDDGGACVAVDLSDPRSLGRALDETAAELIVNAAAYTAVDRAEEEPQLAERINHLAVGEIGAWAACRGATIVHYSTDYVFDGRATQPYREQDPTSPLGVYGQSKLAGEQALAASGAAHLILRTAWVYAAHGRNFLLTMLRLAGEREELRIVADQTGAPTPAGLIARTTTAMVEQWRVLDANRQHDLSGFWHLTAAGRCTWFEFAEAIMADAHAAGLVTRTPRMVPIASADYPTRALRPAFSVLDCSKLQSAFGLHLDDWRHGLQRVIGEIAERRH